MRSYETARSLFSFLGFCAWVVIILGVIAALVGVSAASQMSGFGRGPSGMATLTGLLPGLAMSFVGFIGLALVQIGRAAVDTAEYTQQMLQVARDQLEVSRQGLSSNFQTPHSFADAQSNEVTPATASFSEQKPETPQESMPVRTVRYRAKKIRIENGKHMFNEIPFDSMEEAKKQIDQYWLSEVGTRPTALKKN